MQIKYKIMNIHPIKTEKDYEKALERLEQIFDAKQGTKEGDELEILSNGILLINAIPDFIKKERISNIVEWIIVDIWELWNKKSLTLEEVKNKIFAYTACRSAIKFGHKLSLFGMNKLLNDSILDYSATCPHWRPVVYDIDLLELQGKYER